MDSPAGSVPDQHGRCLATSECRPVRRGDRWECTRPAQAGGSCTDGPRPDGACALPIAPCAPIRSFGSKRALAVRWTALAAVAVLAIGLSARWRYTVLSPGGLSSAHALLAARGEQGCAACHGHRRQRPALAAAAPTPPGDTGRCLACHGAIAGRRLLGAAALDCRRGARAGDRAAPGRPAPHRVPFARGWPRLPRSACRPARSSASPAIASIAVRRTASQP